MPVQSVFADAASGRAEKKCVGCGNRVSKKMHKRFGRYNNRQKSPPLHCLECHKKAKETRSDLFANTTSCAKHGCANHLPKNGVFTQCKSCRFKCRQCQKTFDTEQEYDDHYNGYGCLDVVCHHCHGLCNMHFPCESKWCRTSEHNYMVVENESAMWRNKSVGGGAAAAAAAE
jgi:hypothetical protein